MRGGDLFDIESDPSLADEIEEANRILPRAVYTPPKKLSECSSAVILIDRTHQVVAKALGTLSSLTSARFSVDETIKYRRRLFHAIIVSDTVVSW